MSIRALFDFVSIASEVTNQTPYLCLLLCWFDTLIAYCKPHTVWQSVHNNAAIATGHLITNYKQCIPRCGLWSNHTFFLFCLIPSKSRWTHVNREHRYRFNTLNKIVFCFLWHNAYVQKLRYSNDYAKENEMIWIILNMKFSSILLFNGST